jgi:hypothetical protein
MFINNKLTLFFEFRIAESMAGSRLESIIIISLTQSTDSIQVRILAASFLVMMRTDSPCIS